MNEALDLTQLILRDAKDDDIDALNALRPAPIQHADRIRNAAHGRYRYLVAEMRHELVGFVLVYFRAEPGWDRAGQMPMMMDLFVPERFRSRGVGTAIIAGVERIVMDAGFGHLYLRVEPDRNARAFSLYKRLGYQPLQSTPYEDSYRFVDSSGKVTEGVEWVIDMRKWLA